MTWKKSCTSSKKKKGASATLQQKALDSPKKFCDLWQNCSVKALAKKILWAVPFFMVNTIGRTFFLDVICHWSPRLQKRCWGQHWPCTWMEGIWLSLFLPMRRCWSATKPQPLRRYIITSFSHFWVTWLPSAVIVHLCMHAICMLNCVCVCMLKMRMYVWLLKVFIQVTLLWQRAIGDPGYKRIFCLLHAEKLSYQVCDLALQSLSELSQGKKQGE